MNYYHFNYDENCIDTLNLAYNSINKLELLNFLSYFEPDTNTGFMFCQDTNIIKILNKVNEDYDGHSGSSLAFTLRTISSLLKYNICICKYIEYLQSDNLIEIFKNYTPINNNYDTIPDELEHNFLSIIKKLSFDYVIDDVNIFLINVKNKLE